MVKNLHTNHLSGLSPHQENFENTVKAIVFRNLFQSFYIGLKAEVMG